MITWLWRGWTARKDADAYEHFLLTKLFPSMRTIPGFRGPDVLRHDNQDETALVTQYQGAARPAFRTVKTRRAFPGATPSRIGDKALRHVNPADGDVPAILLKGHVRVSVGEDGS